MFAALKLVESRGDTDFSKWIRAATTSIQVKKSIAMLADPESPELHAHLVFCWVLEYDLTNRNILECEDVLLNLAEQAFDEAKDLEVRKPERYQKPVAILRDIFTEGIILRPWADFALYEEEGRFMDMLEICADIVDIKHEGKYIHAEDQLKKLSQDVEDLLSEVTDAELDDDIKKFLIARLEKISIAIRRYRVGGLLICVRQWNQTLVQFC